MRNLAYYGLGIGFVLMGAALFALTLRKPEAPKTATPTKTQLREQAALAEENRKLRLAAAGIAGMGALFFVLTFF
jgi:hypothetical protein